MEDPQPVDDSLPSKTMPSVIKPKRNRFLKGVAVKVSAARTKAATPLSYAQRSILPTNKNNPLTRMKPLIPNILDKMLIDSINMDAAKKRASGYKWSMVREK